MACLDRGQTPFEKNFHQTAPMSPLNLAVGFLPTPAAANLASKAGSLPFAALFRSLVDLVLQVAGLMIAAELAERRLVQVKQNLPQLLGFGIAGCETLSVNLPQRADQGVSVFAADLAILVAVAIVETCLAHAALHCSRNRQHPPAGTKLQLTPAQNQVRLLHCRAMTPQRWR